MYLKNENKIFVFQSIISKNIYNSAWSSFLSKMRRKKDFERSGKNISEYVGELVRDGFLSHEELNKFLFKELSFGFHKDVFLYKFTNNNLIYEDDIMNILDEEFGVVNPNYNELDKIVFKQGGSQTEKLAAVKLIKDEVNDNVKRISLIFVRQVKYTKIEDKIDFGKKEKKEVPYYENSYFPIEINFATKELMVKSAPKSRINKSEYKGVKISEGIAKTIIKCFDLELVSYQLQYQERLYNMCKTLLEEVINEKCKYELSEFKTLKIKMVKEMKETFNKLGIDLDKLKNTVQTKNVFDIDKQISSMIENVIISKILVEAIKNKEGLDGVISYIKFKDRTLVNTVLKTDCRKNTLLDTQVYLDLRKTLQQSKLAERIRVVWFNSNEEIQLAYDSRKMMYIHLHFYERLLEGDLRYAINRLDSFKY